MKVITFYSYKGGTGRSLSLANTACALNSILGQKVGVLDLDCEAAAMQELFRLKDGNANLLQLLSPKDRNPTNVEKHVVPFAVSPDVSPGIHILPTWTDSILLGEIQWDRGVEVFLQQDVFRQLESLFKLDYLLIDSRSGLSDFATFPLKVSDLVVIVCRLDRQNEEGVKRMLLVYRSIGKPFLVVVSGCPEPKKHRSRIRQFSKSIQAPVDLVVPYCRELYFDEFLAVIDRPRTTLAKSYCELAQLVHDRVGSV